MTTLNDLKILLEKGCTCALSDGEAVFLSEKSGVRPLVEFIESGKTFTGFFAADKIVGKAAALLYAHMGITSIYAKVVSDGALEVCKNHNIAVQYGEKTQKIINRAGTDICPMEKAVAAISDPQVALSAIKEKLKSLR